MTDRPEHPTETPILARAAALGVVAGMRSQLPLALLALAVARGDLDPGGRPGDLLRDPRVRVGLALSAVGEVVGDKLPFAPNRIEPGPLLGRLAFGAVSGALLTRAGNGPPALGAAAGATGALVGTRAGFHVRSTLGRWTGLPDPILAIAEDALAIGLGLRATGVVGRTRPAHPTSSGG